MCSLSVTAESLAGLGLILAKMAFIQTRENALSSQAVKSSKHSCLPAVCTMVPANLPSGSGIPSKSGVGGGILSVVDGEMGIGIFGPALDKKGNSVAGECVLEYMSHELHLHMFDPQRHTL